MSQSNPSKYDLEELARPIIALMDESRDQTIGQVKIHQLLLEGKPVSPKRIAAHLELTQGEVTILLKGAELNQDGNLVGLGLSIVPTPHSYRIHGYQLYTWCAFDTIMFPIFHQVNVEIESPDPISGEKIRFTSTPEGIRDLDPVNAVVTWVLGKENREDVRDWFCDYTNFFTSVETASQYVTRHPGLVIVPIDQAFRIGELLWEREPYKSMMNELPILNQL